MCYIWFNRQQKKLTQLKKFKWLLDFGIKNSKLIIYCRNQLNISKETQNNKDLSAPTVKSSEVAFHNITDGNRNEQDGAIDQDKGTGYEVLSDVPHTYQALRIYQNN